VTEGACGLLLVAADGLVSVLLGTGTGHLRSEDSGWGREVKGGRDRGTAAGGLKCSERPHPNVVCPAHPPLRGRLRVRPPFPRGQRQWRLAA